ncbi:MAG: formylglycine-generating enzyme family protein [Verrucomicrobia bacterium]|nr:formylglycine-generating enzyme family protein [Verrucomicrobiota bacterium]
MKTLLKSLLFAVIAALGVPAFAAPENHEEFARQYMPESQAVFERFRKDCAETQKLRESLAEDLRVMNRALDDDAGYCALSEKITELEKREAEWANTIKDAFFKHKAGMATSEKLSEADAVLAKKSIAWENDVLKNLIKNSLAMFGVPVTVKIPGRNYAFGKYEVTQKEYESVMGRNPSRFKGGNLPVEQVSWNDAVEFCKKLTERERALGRISADQEYRLPTEEEWEHACRAGTTTKYYTGDTEADLARAGWYRRNSDGKTHPVGQKVPNAFGLYDMHGNVWEWTSTPDGTDRVNRGGGCGNSADFCESSYRSSISPEFRDNALGFRVVLSEVQ